MLKRLRIRVGDLFVWGCVGVAVVAVVVGLIALRQWTEATEADAVSDFGPSVQREDEAYKRQIAGGAGRGRIRAEGPSR
jgi:hypothetical protein